MMHVISKENIPIVLWDKISKMISLKLSRSMLMLFFTMASCGPVVLTVQPDHRPPPWFYPNRVEIVRYVYFPEFRIYYDLSLRSYLYLDNGAWIRVKTLPPSYGRLDLNRARYVRIPNYQGDDIGRYHDEQNGNRGRSNLNTPRRQNR